MKSYLLNTRLKILSIVMQSQQSSSIETEPYCWSRLLVIVRFIKFILIHGAQVTVKVIDVDYRQSPLVQGGLESPVLMSIAMDCSDSNRDKIKKLEILLNKYYKEPVNGKFEDATEAVLRTILSDDEDVDSTDDSGEDED